MFFKFLRFVIKHNAANFLLYSLFFLDLSKLFLTYITGSLD